MELHYPQVWVLVGADGFKSPLDLWEIRVVFLEILERLLSFKLLVSALKRKK